MTTEMIGWGGKFETGTNATPPVYTVVAKVTSLSAPSLSMDTVDSTHMGSTGGWREAISGLKDPGEVTVELNFIPDDASQLELLNRFSAGTLDNYRITYPDGTNAWPFKGYVTSFEPEFEVNEIVKATVTIKLSGKPGFIT
jgi:predicted secreted protein